MTDREAMQQALEHLDRVMSHGSAVQEAKNILSERLAQPEQEPVAWRWKERINGDFDSWVISASEPPPYAIEQQPLYTAPPQRTWVGLTATEVHETEGYEEDRKLYRFARAIEAKLREKNT